MKLFFQNSKGEERLIAEPANREEVNKEINKFLEDHNFKSYYIRVLEADGRLIFDVGSHTEFFILEGRPLKSGQDQTKNRLSKHIWRCEIEK